MSIFENEYQGGPSFLLFTPQGDKSIPGESIGISSSSLLAKKLNTNYKYSSSRSDDSVDVAQANITGSVGNAGERITGAIKKEFDKSVRGYVYTIKNNAKMTIPKNDKKPLGLFQPYVVLQVYIESGIHSAYELVLRDSSKTKRRLVFSTSFTSIHANPLHAQIPLTLVRRNVWLNLCMDLNNLCEELFKATYKALDAITIASNCKLRKIFTLKSPPLDTSEDDEILGWSGEEYEGMLDSIPKLHDYPPGIHHSTQLINWNKLILAENKTAAQNNASDHTSPSITPTPRNYDSPTKIAFGRRLPSSHPLPSQSASNTARRPHTVRLPTAYNNHSNSTGRLTQRTGTAPSNQQSSSTSSLDTTSNNTNSKSQLSPRGLTLAPALDSNRAKSSKSPIKPSSSPSSQLPRPRSRIPTSSSSSLSNDAERVFTPRQYNDNHSNNNSNNNTPNKLSKNVPFPPANRRTSNNRSPHHESINQLSPNRYQLGDVNRNDNNDNNDEYRKHEFQDDNHRNEQNLDSSSSSRSSSPVSNRQLSPSKQLNYSPTKSPNRYSNHPSPSSSYKPPLLPPARISAEDEATLEEVSRAQRDPSYDDNEENDYLSHNIDDNNNFPNQPYNHTNNHNDVPSLPHHIVNSHASVTSIPHTSPRFNEKDWEALDQQTEDDSSTPIYINNNSINHLDNRINFERQEREREKAFHAHFQPTERAYPIQSLNKSRNDTSQPNSARNNQPLSARSNLSNKNNHIPSNKHNRNIEDDSVVFDEEEAFQAPIPSQLSSHRPSSSHGSRPNTSNSTTSHSTAHTFREQGLGIMPNKHVQEDDIDRENEFITSALKSYNMEQLSVRGINNTRVDASGNDFPIHSARSPVSSHITKNANRKSVENFEDSSSNWDKSEVIRTSKEMNVRNSNSQHSSMHPRLRAVAAASLRPFTPPVVFGTPPATPLLNHVDQGIPSQPTAGQLQQQKYFNQHHVLPASSSSIHKDNIPIHPRLREKNVDGELNLVTIGPPSLNQPSIKHSTPDSGDVSLMYDPILKCYYDPATNRYYELKA